MTYKDGPCDWEQCFPCQFNQQRVFTLKGLGALNNEKLMDTKYSLLLEKMFVGEIVFQGVFGKSLIVYQRPSKVWFLQFVNPGSNMSQKIASCNNSSEFPIGKQPWIFSTENNIRQTFLKFSQVNNLPPIKSLYF